MTDFWWDYLSVWCLIPRGGLAVRLSVERQTNCIKVSCYVCNEPSAICEGMPMIFVQ